MGPAGDSCGHTDLSAPGPRGEINVGPYEIATLVGQKHSNIGNFTQLSLTLSHCRFANSTEDHVCLL